MRFTFFEPGDGYRIETCPYYEEDQVDRFGYGVGSAYYLEVEIVRVMDKGFEAMQYQSRALIDRNMLENRRRRQSEVIQLLSPSVADNPGSMCRTCFLQLACTNQVANAVAFINGNNPRGLH